MSDAVEQAKQYIKNNNCKEALKLARKRHGKDDIDEYIAILDLLIDNDYLIALEEKGTYYQYYDETHDNGDYGERYFNAYLEKQPRSINVICDKALSRFNKNHVEEALELMNKAYDKYSSYSKIEKPRISKGDVKLGKIELLMQAKRYHDALIELNAYENQFPENERLILYKGQMLQKEGKNEDAIKYLNQSLKNEDTLLAFNSRGDAHYELKHYKDALNDYNKCISHEKEIEDNLELITNFNYKSAYCCIKLGNEQEGMKYLNKTIEMLNQHGRLPKDIEEIYQKCSFEKERILKEGKIKDIEFKKSKFLPYKYVLVIVIIIVIISIILRFMGYGN